MKNGLFVYSVCIVLLISSGIPVQAGAKKWWSKNKKKVAAVGAGVAGAAVLVGAGIAATRYARNSSENEAKKRLLLEFIKAYNNVLSGQARNPMVARAKYQELVRTFLQEHGFDQNAAARAANAYIKENFPTFDPNIVRS